MAFCVRCGAPVDDTPFCAACGAAQDAAAFLLPELPEDAAAADNARLQVFSPDDVAENRLMALLSYLGFLCLIPYLAARTSPFAHVHAVRGMNLLLLELLYLLGSALLNAVCALLSWQLALVVSAALSICGLFFLWLSALGIAAACRGESRSLPLVSGFRLIQK